MKQGGVVNVRRTCSRLWTVMALLLAVWGLPDLCGEETGPVQNVLLNPYFEFHAFENHRLGHGASWVSHDVAFWNTGAWGDLTVMRESHVKPDVRPDFTCHNMVRLSPGRKMWQFFTLSEAGLAHREKVSLYVYGFQAVPTSLVARIKLMKLDSEDGEWTPRDFGLKDERTFPKYARGELVTAKVYEADSDQAGAVELRIEGAEILGRFKTERTSRTDDLSVIGITVEFENRAGNGQGAWVAAPCLCRSDRAVRGAPLLREPYPWYRHIPRTIQKLWKGEAIHILAAGSSIDRASANPPPYPYDEDPDSPTFKQPLADDYEFDPAMAGRPDLEGYVGWWRHYWSYTGRLRLELMRKFNLPVSKICLNFMACDGSCIGEAHSAVGPYCALALPPTEGGNGHKSGSTWQELYPELFTRPEGPGPDLVIFGCGANEKTDTPDEVAVYEGMIRWIQHHYPQCEFLFCQFSREGNGPNLGDMQALSLRYQIPYVDFAKVGPEVGRWGNLWAMSPDGHPAASGHYVWFKQIEKAFECWDPIVPGQAQLRLPARVHPNSYGWEGELVTYDADSPRIRGNRFVLDDTVVNCWVSLEDGMADPYVDGVKIGKRQCRSRPSRDLRNSSFRHGHCRLGDRHILEMVGKACSLLAVDAKVCPKRRFIDAGSALWRKGTAEVTEFKSEWGAPYGTRQLVVQPGGVLDLDMVCTDLSVAYVDSPEGGTLQVLVDGREVTNLVASVPFVTVDGKEHFMENRKGILNLGFGVHALRLKAVDAPVGVLGVFAYDSRPNRGNERRLWGQCAAGETVTFSPPFRARPVVICQGGVAAGTEDVTRESVTFSGKGQGMYEVIGE